MIPNSPAQNDLRNFGSCYPTHLENPKLSPAEKITLRNRKKSCYQNNNQILKKSELGQNCKQNKCLRPHTPSSHEDKGSEERSVFRLSKFCYNKSRISMHDFILKFWQRFGKYFIGMLHFSLCKFVIFVRSWLTHNSFSFCILSPFWCIGTSIPKSLSSMV